MPFQFIITDGAKEDFRRCMQVDSCAAAEIIAFLREVESQKRLCDVLVDTNYVDHAVASVDGIWSFHNRSAGDRARIYRVKLAEIGRWRIITAVDYRMGKVAVLGIMPRDVDYNHSDPYIIEIGNRYDILGFSYY